MLVLIVGLFVMSITASLKNLYSLPGFYEKPFSEAMPAF